MERRKFIRASFEKHKPQPIETFTKKEPLILNDESDYFRDEFDSLSLLQSDGQLIMRSRQVNKNSLTPKDTIPSNLLFQQQGVLDSVNRMKSLSAGSNRAIEISGPTLIQPLPQKRLIKKVGGLQIKLNLIRDTLKFIQGTKERNASKELVSFTRNDYKQLYKSMGMFAPISQPQITSRNITQIAVRPATQFHQVIGKVQCSPKQQGVVKLRKRIQRVLPVNESMIKEHNLFLDSYITKDFIEQTLSTFRYNNIYLVKGQVSEHISRQVKALSKIMLILVFAEAIKSRAFCEISPLRVTSMQIIAPEKSYKQQEQRLRAQCQINWRAITLMPKLQKFQGKGAQIYQRQSEENFQTDFEEPSD